MYESTRSDAEDKELRSNWLLTGRIAGNFANIDILTIYRDMIWGVANHNDIVKSIIIEQSAAEHHSRNTVKVQRLRKT